MDYEKYDLISNFKTEEEPLIQIAVKAAGLKHVAIGPAHNALGEKLPREQYKGLYIEKAFHQESKKEIELHFHAYSLARKLVEEGEKRK